MHAKLHQKVLRIQILYESYITTCMLKIATGINNKCNDVVSTNVLHIIRRRTRIGLLGMCYAVETCLRDLPLSKFDVNLNKS